MIEVEKMMREKCKKEIKSKEAIKIVSRYDDKKVLFESDTATTMKECVKEVVKKGVNLIGANLEDANLIGANLESANLEDANLIGANLEDAKTEYCTVNFNKLEYEQAKQFIEGLQ